MLIVSSGPSPETRSEVKSKGNSVSDDNQLLFFSGGMCGRHDLPAHLDYLLGLISSQSLILQSRIRDTVLYLYSTLQ